MRHARRVFRTFIPASALGLGRSDYEGNAHNHALDKCGRRHSGDTSCEVLRFGRPSPGSPARVGSAATDDACFS